MLNIHASKCWVSRDASGNSNFVTETKCDKYQHDQWWNIYPDPVDPSYYHFASLGGCLTIRNFGPNPYVAVIAACGHYADQEWFVRFRGPSGVGGASILQRKNTGQYLAPKTADNWSPLATRPAQGNDWEEWHLASTAAP